MSPKAPTFGGEYLFEALGLYALWMQVMAWWRCSGVLSSCQKSKAWRVTPGGNSTS
jgi:hypothetical protein